MALQGTQRTSRLSQMQMRFQNKQQAEREQKKIDLLGTTTRTLPKLPQPADIDDTKLLTSSLGAGKVRQMFEERRVSEKVGVDKSYPLKPISGNDRISKANGDTVRAPLKARVSNGNIHTRPAPKAAPPHDNDHMRHDRDPLNNTVVPSYTSANRVPSLNKAATNNNHINGNGVAVGARKPVPAVPKVATNTERAKVESAVTRRSTPSSTASSNTSPKKEVTAPLGVKKVSSASPKKEAPVPPPEGMAQCKVCGRNFLEERIAKHETICSKTVTKKRKVFDSTKHRVKGTEAEVYVKKSAKVKTKTPEKPAKKGDWRKKHEEFIAAIRAAKEVQAHLAKGGKLSDLPPPPPSENPDYVQCPHCSRRFNEAAATRHIPKCATMLHNKPKPKATTVARKR